VLSDPDHVGTQVPLLAAWLILDRAWPKWQATVAVAAILTWAQVADPLVTYEGVLPIAIVCCLRLYQRRDRYELALAAGALASTAAADLCLRLIQHANGFVNSPLDTTFAPVATMSSHLWVTVDSILGLFGADFSGRTLGLPSAVPLLHLAAVIAAGWAVISALRRFTDCDLVTQVLSLATVVTLIAFTIGGSNADGGPHEIAGVLPVGAVLAGRLLTDRLLADRPDRTRRLVMAGAVLACFGAILLHELPKPLPADRNARLAAWLSTHHLRDGLATYWNAASVTVDSGGAVQVDPIDRNRKGRISAVHRDTAAAWYDPARHEASFLVLPRWGMSCSIGARWQWQQSAKRAFGPPAASYRVAGYTVLVWQHNLLGHLAQLPPGDC
jgi:hypothetical protein